MTANDLRAWQAHMGLTYETAAAALGMSRAGYAKMVLGQSQIDHRTDLACAALANGLQPWSNPACKAKIVGIFVGTHR